MWQVGFQIKSTLFFFNFFKITLNFFLNCFKLHCRLISLLFIPVFSCWMIILQYWRYDTIVCYKLIFSGNKNTYVYYISLILDIPPFWRRCYRLYTAAGWNHFWCKARRDIQNCSCSHWSRHNPRCRKCNWLSCGSALRPRRLWKMIGVANLPESRDNSKYCEF